MPSGTMKRWRSGRSTRLSGWIGRRRPRLRTRRPAGRRSRRQLQHGVADLELVATLHDHRTGDLATVQVRAVGRAEILDVDLAVAHGAARVQLGRVRVVDGDLAAGRPPDRDLPNEREGAALQLPWGAEPPQRQTGRANV